MQYKRPPPYKGETPWNQSVFEQEMKRCLRVSYGFLPLELLVQIDNEQRDWIAAYGRLGADDVNDEVKLAAALKGLLVQAMELTENKPV